MCGIAGVMHGKGTSGPPSIDLLRSMIGTLRHRGPDEFGVYRDQHAGLAHARLSIIDLSGGQQPLSNERGSIWIVLNGEIFNFIELRQELLALGHHFRTKSDTEVIVHAYESWGDGCFERFNGQWALALWDSMECTLTLSRDRFGVRPLYVHEAGGRVLFGSEVKAIFADPSVSRAIDFRGLDQTFTYWSSIAPISLFREVEELRPGTVRHYFKSGAKTDKVFWTPSFPVGGSDDRGCRFTLSLAEATAVLREKLERATSLRTVRADVPVGSYLSGGLDSSLIAWMGRRAKEGDFRTFSLRFKDAEFDEKEYQSLMTESLESSHLEVMISQEDIADAFPQVIWHAERPLLRTAPVPMFLLSRAVRREGIKAVLTGEGADEILAGYDIFREAKIRRFWARQPNSTLRPRLFERLYPYLARSPQMTKSLSLGFWKRGLDRAGEPGFSHDPRWRSTSMLKRFYSGEVREGLKDSPAPNLLADLPPEFEKWEELSQAQYLEMTTLLSGYLLSSQGDRMLMAHSVEGRFPFLDHEVVEFCNGLPADFKLNILDEKHILKRVARGKIPDRIINRKKQPYRAPDAVSFVRSTPRDYVADLFSDRSLKQSGLFDSQTVQGLFQKCVSHAREQRDAVMFSNFDNMAFVGILSAQLLYKQFITCGCPSEHGDITFGTIIDRKEYHAQG